MLMSTNIIMYRPNPENVAKQCRPACVLSALACKVKNPEFDCDKSKVVSFTCPPKKPYNSMYPSCLSAKRRAKKSGNAYANLLKHCASTVRTRSMGLDVLGNSMTHKKTILKKDNRFHRRADVIQSAAF